MISRSDIVSTARAYIGTPFVHGGRLRGVGIDCAGLIECVARDTGIVDATVGGYARLPDPVLFRATLREYLDEIPLISALPGDVLSFRFEVEQHLGIVTGENRSAFLHAFARHGSCVEHSLGRPWFQRVVAAWRYRAELSA